MKPKVKKHRDDDMMDLDEPNKPKFKRKKAKKGKKRERMMDIEPIYNIEEHDEAIDNPEVLQRYLQSGEICKKVLQSVLLRVKPGVKCSELCKYGDSLIVQCLNGINDPKVKKKGIAFPTCVGNGRILCNYCPDEKDQRDIRENQEVRIELGVHVDGYAAVVGTTMFVEEKGNSSSFMEMGNNFTEEEEVEKSSDTDRSKCIFLAKVIVAMTMRMMKPGMFASEIGKLTKRLCDEFDVVFLQGLLSHEMKRYVIDGCNCILHHPTVEHQVTDFRFKKNSVYCLDIAISTNTSNSGKSREEKYTPMMLKREMLPHPVFLKHKSAEKLLRIIEDKYDSFPFPLKEIPNDLRLGLSELKKKGLVVPIPVLFRKRRELVARVLSTVMIGENKIVQLTTPFFQNKYLTNSLNSIFDEKVKKVLSTNLEF